MALLLSRTASAPDIPPGALPLGLLGNFRDPALQGACCLQDKPSACDSAFVPLCQAWAAAPRARACSVPAPRMACRALPPPPQKWQALRAVSQGDHQMAAALHALGLQQHVGKGSTTAQAAHLPNTDPGSRAAPLPALGATAQGSLSPNPNHTNSLALCLLPPTLWCRAGSSALLFPPTHKVMGRIRRDGAGGGGSK